MGEAKRRGTFEERKAAATPKVPHKLKNRRHHLVGMHPITFNLMQAAVFNGYNTLTEKDDEISSIHTDVPVNPDILYDGK